MSSADHPAPSHTPARSAHQPAGAAATATPALRAAAGAALATVAFGVVHSLLASRRLKRTAERLVGERAARGGYRVAYNGVAIGMTGALAAYVLRDRGPFVYELRGPAAWAVRAGQLAALGVVLRSAVDAGLADLSGVGPLWRWLTGGPLAPAPDGQGPAERAPGDFDVRGPFAHTRQPLNFFAVPVLWLAPRASAARLGVNVVGTVYLFVGSYHANAMLRERNGEGWEGYARGVPLFVPR